MSSLLRRGPNRSVQACFYVSVDLVAKPSTIAAPRDLIV